MFWVVIVCWMTLPLSAQSWMGQLFTTDTLIRVENLEDVTHLICNVSNGIFYYVEAKAFKESDQEYAATFFSVDLGRYASSKVVLTIPSRYVNSKVRMGAPWIYDFQFLDNSCVVSIQNKLCLYSWQEQQYKLDTMYDCENAKMCYLYQGDVYYMEEDHDFGYRWYRLCRGCRKLVRTLEYEAPHVVQASPNRYLFRDDHYVYFLSNRFPHLYRFTLDGEPVDTITFALPSWHPFEDEYVKTTLQVPYGIDRIKSTMQDIYSYSYPKMVFPVGGDYLLYYTQYDTMTHKSKLQFALRTDGGRMTLYDRKPAAVMTYQDTVPPFTLLERGVNKASLSWNDKLLEIVWADTVSSAGLTDSAYRQERELFYRTSSPALAVKVSTYKKAHDRTASVFYNDHGNLQALSNLPLGKHVILLNEALECSGCRKAILSWLDNLKGEVPSIVIAYSYLPGALTIYEWREDVRKYLKAPFFMLCLDRERCDHYPCCAVQPHQSFPGILLYESGQTPVFIPLEDIFTDDVYTYQFRDSFVDRVMQFLKHR